MATYKGIQGYSVQKLSSDPPDAAAVGQLWYNSGTGKFKIGTQSAGTWAAGTAMNTARRWGASAQRGSPSAGQIGAGGPATSPSANTEQYNGTSWTEVNNMTTAAFGKCGTGTQTNAIGTGGVLPATVESWDGTCWTEVNELNTYRYQAACAGTGNTSALVAGGAPGAKVIAETWNGTSWTETGDLGTARYAVSGGGTATAALAMGGIIVPDPAYSTASVEEFNGTSWTELNGLSTDRGIGAAAVTDTNNAVYFAGATIPGGGGGVPANQRTLTEKYDGTSWTETGDLATGRAYANGLGTAGSALCMGGGPLPPGSALTEEWTDPVYSIKTVTVS